MPLAVSHVLANIKHELGGGDLSIELDKIGIINQAGHFLYSMHPWRWIQARSALIDLRGSVSGSTATWTFSSPALTLTQTSGFTNYTFLAGDEVVISSGTGATTGVYKVASRTSANAIVLTGSLSGSNLATGDIVWRIDPGTIALPTDLRDIIWIATASSSSVGGVTLTSHQQILEARSSSASITASTGHYYGAVVFTGSPPRPILEIWPSPSSNSTGALRIAYRARWTELTTDSAQVNVPEWLEDLFLWVVRTYAAGYERGDAESIHQRLMSLKMSPIFEAAVRSDGMVQPYHGRLRGGGPSIWRNRGSSMSQIVNRVPGPS